MYRWPLHRWIFLAAGLAATCAIQAAQVAAPASLELALVDMQGQKKVLATVPGVVAPRVSPDGSQVVFEEADPRAATGPQTVLPTIARLEKMDEKRVLQPTLTTVRNYYPVWSHDGDWIAFVAVGNGSDAIFVQRADASIQPQFQVDGPAPEAFFAGGLMGQLAFLTVKGQKDYGIGLFDLSSRKVTARIDLPNSAQRFSDVSADGRWIAYTSDETGRPEIWVEPLPLNGQRFQLTKNGGSRPQWSPDGSRIYFDQGGRIHRLDVKVSGGMATAGEPAALPITGFQQGDLVRQYDLTRDGRAFVMLFPARAN